METLMTKRVFIFSVLFSTLFLLGACAPAIQYVVVPADGRDTSPEATNSPVEVTTPTPQPNGAPATFGPNEDDLPPGYNPLTGQPMVDPSLADIPAMLVSISHFPATARPQAGLSFAPFVFEFSITEGATRHLAAFYGEYPTPEIPVKGDCPVRSGPFEQTGLILGNLIWFDKNEDGIQNINEGGVTGICVNLYDAAGNSLGQTTTDSNGYYGFNVVPGHYILEVVKPGWLNFTGANIGDEKADSDTDPLTGRMEADVTSSLLHMDSGLIPSTEVTPPPDPSAVMPIAQVGPVRSGRLLYAHVSAFFQDSCLIYAFASPEVLSEIPKCSFVSHEDSAGGSMIERDRFIAVAEENARNTHSDINYSSNLYAEEPPAGGSPALQIDEYWAFLNQSGWKYDPLSQSWLRYVDTSEEAKAGILHAEIDRLTGRQLHFENVIVIFAEHEVVSPTNLNIHLDQGNLEPAMLFRDGMMHQIQWSTISGDYEQRTGLRRPIQFVNLDGTPAALKPGHTWVTILTPFSSVTESPAGHWNVRFFPPEGSK
jgi:hypothetical protein